MGKRGPQMAPVVLSDEEEKTLRRWADRPSTAQALARRSRIVLACAAGLSNTDVAVAVGVTGDTVGKWRRRFVEQGLGDLCRRGGVGKAFG